MRSSPPKLLVVAALFWVLAGGSACGGGGPAATSVKLTSFKFEPGTLSATAGQPVKLTLENPDTVVHDLTVKGLDKAASPKVQPKQTVSFEFTPTKAGTYEIVCTEAGHEQAGMKGTLTVK